MSEILDILQETALRLDRADIPYMVTGSIALDFYAQPRMTRDLDIVVAAESKDADRLFRAFSGAFYIDQGAVEEAIRTRGMVNAIHEKTVVKIDLIVRKDEEYRIQEFKRRREIVLEGGIVLKVVTPEDLLLSKLAWSGDSELQQRDARAIVGSVGNLDIPYLRHWAGKLGIAERLERILG